MLYYFWMITWMKEANNFQKSKVQTKGVAYILLACFANFSLLLLIKVLLIKVLLIKKACSPIAVLIDFTNFVIAIHVYFLLQPPIFMVA